MLLAGIKDVVLRKVFRGQDKRQMIAEIVKIFLGQHDARKRVHGRIGNIFNAFSLIVIKNVRCFLELAIDGIAVQRFNTHFLRVGIVVARLFKDGFLSGKLLDQALYADILRLRRIQRTIALLAICLCC